MGIIMDSYIVALVLGLIIVTVFFLKRKWSKYNLPPGPPGIPFIGNAWQIDDSRTFLEMTELGKKYGDIFKIKMYGQDIIIVSGEEYLRKALVTDTADFAGRPRHRRIDLMRYDGFHVSFLDYTDRLRQLKKLLLNCMKMYGEGLHRLEELVTEMTVQFMETCQATNGEPHDFENDIFAFMMNIMISLSCASRMTQKEIREFVENEKPTMPLLGSGNFAMILDLVPWSKYLPLQCMKIIKEYRVKAKEQIQPYVQDRKDAFDGRNVECLVDAMLKFNATCEEDDKYTDADIRAVVLEICGAGISTSTYALNYLLGLCVVRQDIQKRIQSDIDKHMGSRSPTLDDKPNMAYLEACIFETLRIISHVPFMLPHKTCKDVELGGYNIPKDTQIWMNSWSLHHDERYWEEPWTFKPERFLTEQGELVLPDHVNRRRLMAFGAGRRVCMGEAMAKNRLFLLSSFILQRFSLLPEADDKLPDVDPRHLVCALVLHPPNYKMRMIPRS